MTIRTRECHDKCKDVLHDDSTEIVTTKAHTRLPATRETDMSVEKGKRDYGSSDPSRLRALASCGKLPAEGIVPEPHPTRSHTGRQQPLAAEKRRPEGRQAR
jgi:hypothetical protein